MIGAGSIEDFVKLLKNGGWEMFEDSGDTPAQKATSLSRAWGTLTAEDQKTIQTAWAEFAASPGGRMALQALIDRTLNRPVFITHLGLSAEQVAIAGAAREGQNQVVTIILNQIRLAHEEPTQQREA